MPFVEIENGKLYYEISGKGQCLVLIHGAWASHKWWRWQVNELSRYYQVLTFDVRGHGQSSKLEGPCSVDLFVKDLETLLLKVGVSEPVLVGWSMGGIISIQYCLDHPSKVKSLVLIASRGHKNPQMKVKMWLYHLIGRLVFAMDIAAPRKYNRVALRFPAQQKWIEKEVKGMLSETTPKEVFDWVMADLLNNPRETYFEITEGLLNWDAGERLKEINVPTLIMAGEKDNHIPPSFSRLLYEEIQNSMLIIVEKAGHCLPLEQPERVNREVINFLKSVGY